MALRKESLSPSTVNHVLKTLKIMTGEAVRFGYLAADPAKSVRQLKETLRERGILTLDEIRALFDEKKIGKIWDGDFRHFALNVTAASCGLRFGEVLALTVLPDHESSLSWAFFVPVIPLFWGVSLTLRLLWLFARPHYNSVPS